MTPANIITVNGQIYRRVDLAHDEDAFRIMERGQKNGLTRNRSMLGKAAMQQVRHLRHRGRRA